jgi:hypothetical protein
VFWGSALKFSFSSLRSFLFVIVTASIEIAQRQDAWFSAVTTLAAVIAVQVGYLGGVAVGVVADHAVTPDDRAPLSFVQWFSRFIHP